MANSDRLQLFTKGADSTLALLAYAAVAIAIMVLDRRLGYLNDMRATSQSWVAPIWHLAEVPGKATSAALVYFSDRYDLELQRQQLERQRVQDRAEIALLRARLQDFAAIRTLLGENDLSLVSGKVARVLRVDLDRQGQRIALSLGKNQGIMLNAVVVDELGLVGQIMEVGANSSAAILITDERHQVPAELVRNGLRTFVIGNGSQNDLSLNRIAQTSDVQVGDLVQTSGMGGVFPAGLAIGVVSAVHRSPDAALMQADVKPASKLALGKVVLILPPLASVAASAQVAVPEAQANEAGAK